MSIKTDTHKINVALQKFQSRLKPQTEKASEALSNLGKAGAKASKNIEPAVALFRETLNAQATRKHQPLTKWRLRPRLHSWLQAKTRRLNRKCIQWGDAWLHSQADRYRVPLDYAVALFEASGRDFSFTKARLRVFHENASIRSRNYHEKNNFRDIRDQEATRYPDKKWIESMTCRVPYRPSFVRQVLEWCEGDRKDARRILEHCAQSGTDAPSFERVQRLRK